LLTWTGTPRKETAVRSRVPFSLEIVPIDPLLSPAITGIRRSQEMTTRGKYARMTMGPVPLCHQLYKHKHKTTYNSMQVSASGYSI
jgi:hypothetical protein